MHLGMVPPIQVYTPNLFVLPIYVCQFMTDMYRDVCEIALRLKDSRDHLIRKTVVSILPTLARYDPSVFMEDYLHRCMNHLLSLLKKEKDRKDGKCSMLLIWV
jgi:FKBP12-rapamycin complex-associated protein